MKVFAIVYFVIMLIKLQIALSSSRVTITNGPQDTTVCMNIIAECDCGFAGTDPHAISPDWRIVLRSDDGSIISNNTIDGGDIENRLINGLQWEPDLTSGDSNASNSKLLVGPVNMTHNQSSYQCIFDLVRSDTVISSVGTMTVVDPLSVIINVEEICTTSIAITLNTINHQTCGDVSHNVTISGHVIYPDTVGEPIAKYAINELESDRLYNIAVTSTHNSSSRIVKKSVRTFIPKSPNAIDVNSIEIEEINNSSYRLTWKPPVFDKCSMLPVQYYHVRIISSEGEIISEQNDNVTTLDLMFQHLENQLNIVFLVNITVVDIKGLRSASSVSTKTIILSKKEESSNESDNTNDSNVFPVITIVIVAVVVIGLSVLIIIFITYLRYRHLHKSHVITLGKKTEDNSYIETQDESKSHDVASPYAISGPSALLTDSIQSNNNEDEIAHEPMTHNDDELDEDESTPPIPPKQLNYAEIQITNEVPNFMTTDHRVAYAETKPA